MSSSKRIGSGYMTLAAGVALLAFNLGADISHGTAVEKASHDSGQRILDLCTKGVDKTGLEVGLRGKVIECIEAAGVVSARNKFLDNPFNLKPLP